MTTARSADARFRRLKTIDEFRFDNNPAISLGPIRELVTMEFCRRAEYAVLTDGYAVLTDG